MPVHTPLPHRTSCTGRLIIINVANGDGIGEYI